MSKELRTIRIMIDDHDPCTVCTFRGQCSDYGGCMGWTPDDADKAEIVRLKEEIKDLTESLNATSCF